MTNPENKNENENENTEQPGDDENAAANDAEMQAELDQEIADAEGLDDEDTGDVGGQETHDPHDQLAELEVANAELQDKLLRALSEAENTRRIAAREKTDGAKYKNMDLGRDLLGVVDNMTMALASIPIETREADANLKNLYVGIEMTMNELLGAFDRNSIKPIEAEGKQFDHNTMDALGQIPNTDVAEGAVVQVTRPGFMLHDRLLRPAQVLVATGGPKPEKADTQPADADGDAESPAGYEKTGTDPGSNLDQET